jgi:hypothetical protein
MNKINYILKQFNNYNINNVDELVTIDGINDDNVSVIYGYVNGRNYITNEYQINIDELFNYLSNNDINDVDLESELNDLNI